MNETEDKFEYELSYLLTPARNATHSVAGGTDVAEEKLELETADLLKIISENGGETIESSTPKKRWLAYPIKKQTQAYFGVIYFNTSKENLDKIKHILSFNKKLLRFLILNETFKKTEPVTAAPFQAVAEKTSETITPSFDQKLESILNG